MTSPAHDPVIERFVRTVRRELGPRVQQIFLFGARARGEARDGADYDIAIVVDQRDERMQAQVLDAAVTVLDSYDAVVSAHVFSEAEWEIERITPLGLNIQKEGILL